jgi:large subunit ribosomal protein L4
MKTIEIVNINNNSVGNFQIDDNIFSSHIRHYLLTEIINWQRAKKRKGSHAALNKGNVKGSTRKPFKQKGRGLARQGTMKNPHQIGGGVAFPPIPKTYSYKISKTKRRKALSAALQIRNQEGRLKILDSFILVKGKSSSVKSIIQKLNLGKTLIVDTHNEMLKQGSRNLKNVKYLNEIGINVYDILYFPYLLITQSALKIILNRLLKSKK